MDFKLSSCSFFYHKSNIIYIYILAYFDRMGGIHSATNFFTNDNGPFRHILSCFSMVKALQPSLNNLPPPQCHILQYVATELCLGKKLYRLKISLKKVYLFG